MYPSDYSYAMDEFYWSDAVMSTGSTSYKYNWMYSLQNKYYEWTITPESSGNDGKGIVGIWWINPDGYVSYIFAPSTVSGVRPTLNLKTNVMYKSGTGTSSDPYRIMIN